MFVFDLSLAASGVCSFFHCQSFNGNTTNKRKFPSAARLWNSVSLNQTSISLSPFLVFPSPFDPIYFKWPFKVRDLAGTRMSLSDKTWSTGEGNGKPLQYSCLENPMNSMRRQNDRILKEILPRSLGAQYTTGDQWRNNSRKNEGMEPKQKEYPVVDGTGDRSKVRCCKEQYCIGTWNVRSMNQGKLEVVKQEMARVSTF